MASGILIASGQNWVIDTLKTYLDSSGAYVGLMTNTVRPTETSQISAGITEVSGSGYSRQSVSSWTKGNDGGADPYLQGSTVTFLPSGLWSNVNGYFVSTNASGANALWAETFPAVYQDDKDNGDTVLVTPKFEVKDQSEL